jgi:hypothetical protein
MLGELFEWVVNLDRQFAFLLALPFIVALAGLLAHAVTERRRADRGNRVERAERGPRHMPRTRGGDADLVH